MTHLHGFWILSGIVTPPLPWVAYYNARPCFQWGIFFLIINLFILKIFIRYNICLSWSCPFWWTGLPTLIKAMRENLTKPISTTKYCLSKTVGLQASNISWKRKLIFFFNLSENESFLHSHKASVYFFWWVFCLWFSYFIFSGWVLLCSYFSFLDGYSWHLKAKFRLKSFGCWIFDQFYLQLQRLHSYRLLQGRRGLYQDCEIWKGNFAQDHQQSTCLWLNC